MSNFTEKDSCTWLIKAECGLPSITITDLTQEIAEMLSIRFIEYEVESTDLTKVDDMGYPIGDFRGEMKEYDLEELLDQNVG